MNVSEEQLHLEAKEMGKFSMLAKEQFYQGNYFAAIDFFTKSINASQYVFEQSNYVNRGTAYVATGQYQKAIDDFNHPTLDIKELDDQSKVMLNTNLGYSYYMTGRNAEAKKCYENILCIDPQNEDANFMITFKL
jgi:tetratricopeptide (TPR) repeat protein